MQRLILLRSRGRNDWTNQIERNAVGRFDHSRQRIAMVPHAGPPGPPVHVVHHTFSAPSQTFILTGQSVLEGRYGSHAWD